MNSESHAPPAAPSKPGERLTEAELASLRAEGAAGTSSAVADVDAPLAIEEGRVAIKRTSTNSKAARPWPNSKKSPGSALTPRTRRKK